MLLPISLLTNFLAGIFSLVILAVGLAALYRAWHQYQRVSRSLFVKHNGDGPVLRERNLQDERRVRPSEVLSDRRVWIPLALGLFLLLFSVSGRSVMRVGFPSSNDEPRELHSETVQYIQRPDGTRIRAEIFGRPDAPTLVFTHGWGTSSTEWYYAKRDLANRFRLIFWDLPGLGQSTQPSNRDYRLDKMASDLESVVSLAQNKPVVLVGHSIGGMINLTFCRAFPDHLGRYVKGIVQIDTSYTNPVTTAKNASLNRALQKPVGEPLLQAMIWFSPLIRATNWLSYQNGTSHAMNAKSGFAGSETWGQVDLISRYGYESTPSVVARGTLAMFHWDAKPVLPKVNVPVLLIVGQQDTTTLPSASEFMSTAMPRATLQLVTPSAHYGLLEQNKQYNAALDHFASAVLKGTESK